MKHFTGALMAVSSAIAITGATFSTTAYAATNATAKLPKGQVRAQVNGKSIEAISVGNETYVNWAALGAFHTPKQYMGNGVFTVPWGTIHGVVYQGATYIPWTQAAPKVKASKLSGGGFNFTATPVKHNYVLSVVTQAAITGMPAPIEVMVSDGNNPVPGQKVTVETTGNSELENTSGIQTLTDTVDSTGTWLGGLSDMTPQTVTLTVKWKDPTGKTHVHAEQVSFIRAKGSTGTTSGGSGTAGATANATGTNASTGTTTNDGSGNSSTNGSTNGSTNSSNSTSTPAASANATNTSSASSNPSENSTSSQSSAKQTALPGTTVVTTVPMQTFSNEALFSAKSAGDPILFQLDTGAFEPLLNKRTAALLNLPHLTSVQVAGIGGNDNAYMSRITLSIGGVVFQDVPCVVDTSYRGNNLFGYGFFSDNQYNLYASQTSDTLTILE